MSVGEFGAGPGDGSACWYGALKNWNSGDSRLISSRCSLKDFSCWLLAAQDSLVTNK